MKPEAKYPHIIKALFGRPWAIRQETLQLMVEIIHFRLAGGSLSDEEIAARVGAAQNGPRRGGGRQASTVAVIPIYGVLSQRANLFSASSGGTSVEQITGDFRAALADDQVDAVVFDVDSPGGSVDGIEELATEIRAARGGKKPIVAVANVMAASAAYWIASQADELVVTPSGAVGSVGVIAVHEDFSAQNEMLGVKPTYLFAGQYKSEGNPDEPLSDDAREHFLEDVNAYYSMFTSAVARGRGVPIETVRGADYGEGRLLLARDALAAGMVDRIDTLDNTIRRVARGETKDRAAALSIPLGTDAALGSGLLFTERLSLVSAGARALLEHAQEHAEMRANADRSISGETRDQLVSTATTFRGLADALDVIANPVVAEETEAQTKPASRRLYLELLEAAAVGGYQLS